MNDLDKTFEVIKYGMCRCGKNAGTADHECPYDADVNNNPDSICNCCDACCQNCADDI